MGYAGRRDQHDRDVIFHHGIHDGTSRSLLSPPLRRLQAVDSAAVIVRSAGDPNQQLQARAVLAQRGMWRQIILWAVARRSIEVAGADQVQGELTDPGHLSSRREAGGEVSRARQVTRRERSPVGQQRGAGIPGITGSLYHWSLVPRVGSMFVGVQNRTGVRANDICI